MVVIDLNDRTKWLTIDFRTRYKLNIRDAIIAATALFLKNSLISADRIFKRIEEPPFLKNEERDIKIHGSRGWGMMGLKSEIVKKT
jgi:hypothetical protein